MTLFPFELLVSQLQSFSRQSLFQKSLSRLKAVALLHCWFVGWAQQMLSNFWILLDSFYLVTRNALFQTKNFINYNPEKSLNLNNSLLISNLIIKVDIKDKENGPTAPTLKYKAMHFVKSHSGFSRLSPR